MDMNQTGMNPIGINQNGLNPMLMNQMGINQMMMNQMGLNPMLINNQPNQINPIGMDNTTLNIKNIVQPYEKKIKELEEIIRQKDFEITVLKQKLNNNNSKNNFMNMNMNPMIMNNNMNPMMMMENNFQHSGDKGSEILITIKSKDEEFTVKCFQKDKISSLKEKYNNIKGGLTYNYKLLNNNLTFNEAGISNLAEIHVGQIKTLVFKSSRGNLNTLHLSDDCPIGLALIYYLAECPNVLWNFINKNLNVKFLFNANLLKIKDNTIIKKVLDLESIQNRTIIVDY